MEYITCKHCNEQNVQYFEHAERCAKSRKRTQFDGEIKYSTLRSSLHEELQRQVITHLKKILHLELTLKDAVIVDHFDYDPEKADTLKTKIIARQAASPDKDVRHRGDSLWTLTFQNENGVRVLDHTAYGIHSASNWKHTVT